jgi:hypothetical protein
VYAAWPSWLRSDLEESRQRSLVRLAQLGQRDRELLLDVQQRLAGTVVDHADPQVLAVDPTQTAIVRSIGLMDSPA